ncbi:MAG: UDP-N-acetylmuramate dehydrogenase [Lachnospiraceae bacterium]
MNEDLREQLIRLLGSGHVREQEMMSRYTTFKVGGPADFLCLPVSEEQIVRLIGILKKAGEPYLIIGSGSNLLVRDGGIRGAVIRLGSDFAQITEEKEENGSVTLAAQAGAKLSAVGARAADLSLGGFEFACGIPGSVGGAVRMNAGAYGGEIRDVLKSAKILMPDGRVLICTADDLQLTYRHSVLDENGGIVLSAEFCLQKGDEKQIRARMQELADKRREKQPLEYPSAGSTFKRPEGYFAGKLIMDAGLKGFSIGGAQVSEKHAGFVINTGGAKASDIEELIRQVRQRVFEQSGVWLEPEVKIVGDPE